MLGMSLSKGTLVLKTVYTNHLNSVTGADSAKAIGFGRNQPALLYSDFQKLGMSFCRATFENEE